MAKRDFLKGAQQTSADLEKKTKEEIQKAFDGNDVLQRGLADLKGLKGEAFSVTAEPADWSKNTGRLALLQTVTFTVITEGDAADINEALSLYLIKDENGDFEYLLQTQGNVDPSIKLATTSEKTINGVFASWLTDVAETHGLDDFQSALDAKTSKQTKPQAPRPEGA